MPPTRSFAFFIAFAATQFGCNSKSPTPTAPTLMPSESAPAMTWVTWNLTTTVTSMTGRRADCFSPLGSRKIGTPTPGQLMAANRSAESISFWVPDGWNDPYSYVGILVGDDFTATGGGCCGSYTCAPAPMRSDLAWEGRVSGRFSPNGYSLAATEVWVYKFPTGDEVAVHLDWTATRQDEWTYEPQPASTLLVMVPGLVRR